MADPNQTPARGNWRCPCEGCKKAVAQERKDIIEFIESHKLEYLKYRGSSFDADGNLLWAKDDAEAYAEALDLVVQHIIDKTPKKAPRK